MKLNRQTPRGSIAAGRRRDERSGPHTESNKNNTDEKKESAIQIRGNIIHDVWEATQRTVKLIRTVSETRERGEQVPGKTVPRPDPVALGKAGGKSQEKGNHFQFVLAELKAKTRAKTQSRHANQDVVLKLDGSPMSTSPVSRHGRESQDENQSPCLVEGKAFSSSSDQGSPMSVRAWFNKGGMFQKVTTGTERFQFGAIQVSRRKAQNRTPPRLPTQMFRGKKTNNTSDDEITSNNRRHLWFENLGSPRKVARFNLPFKKKNAGIDKSKSLGYFELHGGVHFNDGVDYESMDNSSDYQLTRQIKGLLMTMTSCEQKLASLRMETKKNTSDLRSEVRRLNEVVESITHHQALRYRGLLDDIQENQRTLGHIESGFDYLLSIMNRPRGSMFQNKLYRFVWFLLDQTVASLLILVQISTTFYSRYRFKK